MATRKNVSWIEPGIRRIVLPSGAVRYRVQLGRRGRGKRTSQLCATYAAAAAVKADWTLNGLPLAGAPRISSKHDVIATVDDALRHRALDLEQRGKDASVAERIRTFMARHWPEGAALPLHTVTVPDVEQYRDRRFAAGCKPNTIVRELREIRATLKQARPDGFKLPESVFPDEDRNRVRDLTPRQYGRVFPHLRELHGPVFANLAELACLGVMRMADVRLLKRSYVRMAERVILLPRTKGGPRAVRLSAKALAIVKRAMARTPQHDYVFARPDGKPYSRSRIGKTWRNAARACGLENFTFHDLRHVGPTQAVNAGANDATLMAMGGWKSASMVKRYSHVLSPTLDKYLALIGNGKRRT
jgi:integrase